MTKVSKTPKTSKGYAAPKLVTYGDVSKVTTSGSMGMNETMTMTGTNRMA